MSGLQAANMGNNMKCVHIDDATQVAERLANEERERAQVEYEFVEDGLIDDRVDDMPINEVFEALDRDDSWFALAKLCADSGAKPDDFERLGRMIGGSVRAYAKRLVELEK